MEIQAKINYEVPLDDFLEDSSKKRENKHKFLLYASVLLLIGNNNNKKFNLFFKMLEKYFYSYSWNFYRLFSC